MTHKNSIFLLFITFVLMQSCVSVAKLSDFSRTAEGLDFDKVSTLKKSENDKSWNQKTGYEYYIKSEITDESLIVSAIREALYESGYDIKVYNGNSHTMIGERGLRANEWNSIIGVYYQISNEMTQIYIKCKITQDFTGGWKEDRAEKVGKVVCEKLGCMESYPVIGGQ